MPTFGNFTFTTNGRALIYHALSRVRLTDVTFLDAGDSTITATTSAAKILTEKERKVYNDNPALGIVSATVTASANTNTITLPVAVQGIDIQSLYFLETDNPLSGQEIEIVSREEFEVRTGYELSENNIRQYPSFAAINEDGATLNLSSYVNTAQTFTMSYRNKPTTYTAADIVVGSVVYSAIPDQYNDTLIWLLAAEFDAMGNKGEKVEMCLQNYLAASEDLQKAINNPPGVWRNSALRPFGYPSSPLYKRKFGGIGLQQNSRFGGRPV